MTEVALLPESIVVVLDRAVDRRLRYPLLVSDVVLLENDLGLVFVGFLTVVALLEGSLKGCKGWNCHICIVAFPHFSGLLEPLMDQETCFLWLYLRT